MSPSVPICRRESKSDVLSTAHGLACIKHVADESCGEVPDGAMCNSTVLSFAIEAFTEAASPGDR